MSQKRTYPSGEEKRKRKKVEEEKIQQEKGSAVNAMAEKLLLIDTDCGIDDAQAIMMALAAPGVRMLGITCCFGNASVEDVCQNVSRVLSVCERTEIPVFRGTATPLVGNPDCPISHFGTDGLGDVLEDRDPELWKKQIQSEHAVNAMIRLVSENEGKVSLVAIGPLTNLALAVRLDPSFPQKLKDLFIMGGNMEGKGNRTVCGEFNFVMDPESAYIVLEEFLCPTYIASWEFTCRHKLSWDFFDEWISQDTEAARFMKKITSKCWAYSRDVISSKDAIFGPGFVSYDSYAVAAAIDGSVVTKSAECAVQVELQGVLCRGMMALDLCDKLKKQHRVFVMKECDLSKFRQLLTAALRLPCKT
ncbi:inosine-uridine preferring nucleoside hydrolase isoform X1 [Megalops cyprinoides]|uniref:inosine-uridine preferring nucleoside hydrolase isoform X1 n=2 Tax=Megalops cyprinoides TaxID=118141 RepID=UPI0018649D39|nr:inosine-uridine preferring nucleoside hydrolase isoform X1 [Megalops cyprinoides]